jgi:hypothetical protein
MNDRRIETAVLMKPRHRASENRVHAAVVHPAPPNAVNARVVRFRLAFAVLVDRQFLPLTTQIQDLQNVVEDLVKTQLRCWTAATDREMRQDKLLELRTLQLRRKRLPSLSFRHSRSSQKPGLTGFSGVGRNARTKAAYRQIQSPSKTRNQLLDLLRFFLNHRRYMRSPLAERVGKSPRELMTGESHPHWLSLLGLGPLQNQHA